MSDTPASPLPPGKTVLLQVDGLGSIVAERGSRQGEWSFPPYGQLPSQQAVGVLRFMGQWFDPLVQGYLLGNGLRLYIPVIMRFLSSDSLSPFGAGGINGYAYCSGDPVNFHDPSGRARTGLTKLLIQFDLPKPQLRGYLKPLGRLESFKQRRSVYRLKDGNFEHFEFMGAGKKILGARRTERSAFESYINSESFYRSGELYIPQSAVPQEAVDGLTRAGFTLTRFDVDTYVDAVFPEAASAQPGGMANPGLHRRSNFYATDPVAEVARTRGSQQS